MDITHNTPTTTPNRKLTKKTNQNENNLYAFRNSLFECLLLCGLFCVCSCKFSFFLFSYFISFLEQGQTICFLFFLNNEIRNLYLSQCFLFSISFIHSRSCVIAFLLSSYFTQSTTNKKERKIVMLINLLSLLFDFFSYFIFSSCAKIRSKLLIFH